MEIELRTPTADDVHRLARWTNGPCVSVYQPTHRAGPPTRQDPIVLRNLLDEAATGLEARGVEPEALLATPRLLESNERFWRHQGNGLALMITAEAIEGYRLPATVDAQVHVGRAFHVGPLVAALAEQSFHVLALSRGAVRVLDATRESVRRLELEGVPTSLADAVGHDWEESSLQFHTGAPPAGPGRAAVFHGHGEGGEVDESEERRYCQVLDRALQGALDDHERPLVLAGESSIVATYRRVSDFPDVLEEFVPGNPEAASDESLRDRAWELVARRLEEERARRREEIGAQIGTPLASDDVGEIVRAAHDGRVETLIVERGARRWGRWDGERRTATLRDERGDGDDDLVDLAVRQTLTHGGDVIVLDELETDAVAAFRH